MASSPFPGHMWVVTSKLAWKMRIITQVVAIGTGGVSQGVMVVAALLVTTNSWWIYYVTLVGYNHSRRQILGYYHTYF